VFPGGFDRSEGSQSFGDVSVGKSLLLIPSIGRLRSSVNKVVFSTL